MRPERANHRHHVRQDRILRPVLERLVERLRESEIERAREVLVAAVDAPRGEQLLGANHPEHRAELVADQILPAVAAREREIRRLDVARLGEPGDELRVLVVGVRADHQHARGGAESCDQLAQRSGAALLSGEARRGRVEAETGDRANARFDD